ncbi:hypothetical protein Purlil1_3166 [Purpureocillium lilacinum]|uniref:Uncharacterized protein n=1 Tax=Purpureocillium lilacinum TaxID=33203 RepID=A0ABR0C8K2_PURLI|nr:hypothetical protein Purlil1_3166 [Purpureocillium lilacinum]
MTPRPRLRESERVPSGGPGWEDDPGASLRSSRGGAKGRRLSRRWMMDVWKSPAPPPLASRDSTLPQLRDGAWALVPEGPLCLYLRLPEAPRAAVAVAPGRKASDVAPPNWTSAHSGGQGAVLSDIESDWALLIAAVQPAVGSRQSVYSLHRGATSTFERENMAEMERSEKPKSSVKAGGVAHEPRRRCMYEALTQHRRLGPGEPKPSGPRGAMVAAIPLSHHHVDDDGERTRPMPAPADRDPDERWRAGASKAERHTSHAACIFSAAVQLHPPPTALASVAVT